MTVSRANSDLDSRELESFNHFIDGQFVPSQDGATRLSINPATGAPWAVVAEGGPADVERAVAAAREALEHGSWSSTSGLGRAKLMRRLAKLVESHADDLIAAEVRDNGKILAEVELQVADLIEYFDYFAGFADKITGSVLTTARPDKLVYQLRRPVGVVGAITAWNSPLLILAYKLAPSLATGCTMVVKPSEHTSASSLLLAGILDEAGFPRGVLNVIAGDGVGVGGPLVAHPGVSKVAFTGSSATGIRVAQAAASHLAPSSLELGGKSPNVIFADSDIDAAVAGAVAAIFSAAGQSCVAGSRLLVQREIYTEVVERVSQAADLLTIGDPFDRASHMGPMAFSGHRDHVLNCIKLAEEDGASKVAGGEVPHELRDGFFVRPTVFANVTNEMRIAREEVFGPVLAILPFVDEDDAVRISNDSPFGLAAGVWTKDVARAHRMARRLEVGTVWINSYRLVSFDVPFGGVKQSGYGRENGPEVLDQYLVSRTVWTDTSVTQG